MPAHEPTEKTRTEVRTLASFGIPQKNIADYIGISKPTLAKHYPEELRLASIKANAQVFTFLYSAASGMALKTKKDEKPTGATFADCLRAAMFWAKTRGGWRETDRLEISGRDGEPLVPSVDWTKVPTDVIQAVLAAQVQDDDPTAEQRGLH